MPVFTEVLPIDSQPGASFQLPSTEDVKIMAVRVTVDNSGGSDTQPELAMLAPTGAVIATERQSEAIPSGDSGMASWALRLAKKARAAGGAGPVEYFHDGSGANVADLVWTPLEWAHESGSSLLNLANPLVPTFRTSGVYAVTACARSESAFTWPGFIGLWLQYGLGAEDRSSITTAAADTATGGMFRIPEVTVTEVRTVAAGSTLHTYATHNNGGPVLIGLAHAVVQKLA